MGRLEGINFPGRSGTFFSFEEQVFLNPREAKQIFLCIRTLLWPNSNWWAIRFYGGRRGEKQALFCWRTLIQTGGKRGGKGSLYPKDQVLELPLDTSLRVGIGPQTFGASGCLWLERVVRPEDPSF